MGNKFSQIFETPQNTTKLESNMNFFSYTWLT
jgi:hypothetical protein